MEISKILSLLCTAYGGAGSETAATSKIAALFSKNKSAYDAMGNLAVELSPRKADGPVIMLEAHTDEIGFIVSDICADGRLLLSGVGGVDRRTLYGACAVFLSKKGPVEGVLSADAAEINDKEPLYADIGFSREHCPVAVGDRGYVRAQFTELDEKTLCCKSMDNRVGCAVLIKAAEAIGAGLGCGVYALFSVQEEIGLRGSAAGALGINPDYAVCVDVSFADAPGIADYKTGLFGGGPMIGVSPILSAKITDDLMALAKSHSIPYQTEIMGASTGTNADAVSKTGGGIATGLISVPLRNMHTACEIVSADDVLSSARLLAAYVNMIGGHSGV